MNVVYRIKGDEHAERVVKSAATIRKHLFAPDINCYVDKRYDCLTEAGITQLERPEYFNRPFMLADLACCVDWILSFQGTTLFLDSDVMVRKSFEFPETAWDLAVTWRWGSELEKFQPYNFGVWFANHTSAAKYAVMAMYERCLILQSDSLDWFGNQIAMREVIGPHQESGVKDVALSVPMTCRVLMLPCTTWNYSPNAENEDVSEKITVHLKGYGGRKDYIDHYYREALR